MRLPFSVSADPEVSAFLRPAVQALPVFLPSPVSVFPAASVPAADVSHMPHILPVVFSDAFLLPQAAFLFHPQPVQTALPKAVSDVPALFCIPDLLFLPEQRFPGQSAASALPLPFQPVFYSFLPLRLMPQSLRSASAVFLFADPVFLYPAHVPPFSPALDDARIRRPDMGFPLSDFLPGFPPAHPETAVPVPDTFPAHHF